MKNKLYAIKDNKIGFLNAPFIAPNNAAAIRMFGDTVINVDTLLNKHPEDYELYALGEMDENTGELFSEVKYLETATAFKTIK